MSPDSDTPRQKRGENLRRAVLEAVIARIESDGIDQVRIADVAAEAGVHETSIYRRWKTRPQLVLDALLSQLGRQIPIPDSGSVRDDLLEFMAMLIDFGNSAFGAALIRSVSIDVDGDTSTVRRAFWSVRMSAAEEIVRRGIKRGEIARDTDPHLPIAALGGLVHMYVTQFDGEIPHALADSAVEMVLTGVAAGRRQDRSSSTPLTR